MQILTSLVFAYVINALWILPLLVVASEMSCKLSRGLQPRVLHRIWLACFALAITVPALPLLFSSSSTQSVNPAAPTLSSKSAQHSGEEENVARAEHVTNPKKAASAVPLLPVVSGVVCWFYLGSVLFATVRLAVGLWRTRALVLTASPIVMSPERVRIWEEGLAVFHQRRTKLLFSSTISSPATINWPTPIVIFPTELHDAPEGEMAAALCHELAHVQRYDFLINLLCESAGAMIFFHPALYWIRRRIRQTRELACDDVAAEVLRGRRTYAQSLLRLAQRMRSMVDLRAQDYAVGIFEEEILEERVMNLSKVPSPVSHLRRAFYVAVCTSMFFAACILGVNWGLRPAYAQAASQTDHPPAGWFLAGSKPQNYRSGVDKSEIRDAQPSAYLQSSAPTVDGFGTLMQSIAAGKYAGKRIRLRAWVKSQDVSDWAGLWLRVDKEQTPVAFDNMQNRAIRGTQSWKMHDVVLDVPGDATGISFGILLGGTGRVWMNHVSFEEVDKSVATTSSTPAAKPAVPETPVNLNFDK